LDGAGKTTILNELRFIFNLIEERHEDTMPTVGQNVCKGLFGGIHFTFRDASGTEKFRKYWVDSFKESHIIVFVVDCSNPARFEEVNVELQKLSVNPQLQNAPVLVLAHKQDIAGAVTPDNLRPLLSPSLSAFPIVHFQGSACSAQARFGIEDMLRWACTVDVKLRAQYVDTHKDDPDPD